MASHSDQIISLQPFPQLTDFKFVQPILPYLNHRNDIVRFKFKEFNRDHFEFLKKCVFDQSFVPTFMCWQWIEYQLLQNSIDTFIDPRITSYKLDQNVLMVSPYFSTGLCEAKEGTKHLYQIGSKSMTLYTISKEEANQDLLICYANVFPTIKEHCFKRMPLKAYKSYVIPSNIIYNLCSYTATFFSVHILKAESNFPATLVQHNP